MNCKHAAIVVQTLCLVSLLLAPTSAKMRRVQRIANGTWGGAHIVMQVTNGAASIEYDCAHGNITGPLVTDRQGSFKLRGIHIREHPGSIREDERSNGLPARYTGWTDGKKMNLTVSIEGTNEVVGTFWLVRGQQGRQLKCK